MNPARTAAPNSTTSIHRRCSLALRALAIAAFLAPTAVAQYSFTTIYNGVPVGGAGPNQVFFNLVVKATPGITISSLDLNLADAYSTLGTIDLRTIASVPYLLPATNLTTVGSWSLPNTGTVFAEGPGKPSHVCFGPSGVWLPTGVHAVSLEYFGVFANATLVTTPAAPSLAGGNADLDFYYGDSKPVAWGLLSPPHMVFNGTFHYRIGNGLVCTTCANKESYGLPCASLCAPFLDLTLDSNFPVLGETVKFETTGASSCAVLGVNIFGFTPMFVTPLTVPNLLCYQHLTVDITMLGTPIAGAWDGYLAIPDTILLCGITFYSQSATFEWPSGDIVTSNGLKLTIGN